MSVTVTFKFFFYFVAPICRHLPQKKDNDISSTELETETWKGQEKQRWGRGEQHERPNSTCDPGSWHWTCKIRGSQYTTTITQTGPEQNPSTLLLMSIHLVINWMFVSPPIQIQTPNVMVFGGRASGRQWSHWLMRFSVFI